MAGDSDLILTLLRRERAATETILGLYNPLWQAGERVYLARLNAEIARHIPQGPYHYHDTADRLRKHARSYRWTGSYSTDREGWLAAAVELEARAAMIEEAGR